MRATYAYAEPGVIFIDRINRRTISGIARRFTRPILAASSRCPLMAPACSARSIWRALVERSVHAGRRGSTLDRLRGAGARRRAHDGQCHRYLAASRCRSSRRRRKHKRRIGLGVTGLADALILCGLRYGSPAGGRRDRALAGGDPARGLSRLDRAGRRERRLSRCSTARNTWPAKPSPALDPDVRDAIAKHGIRNALLTSIAPTGTISLFADNVSSGLEPVFSFRYTRKRADARRHAPRGGSLGLRLPAVPPAARRGRAAARLFRRCADPVARRPCRDAGGGAELHRQLDLEDDQLPGGHPVRGFKDVYVAGLCARLQGLHDLPAERGHRRGAGGPRKTARPAKARQPNCRCPHRRHRPADATRRAASST